MTRKTVFSVTIALVFCVLVSLLIATPASALEVVLIQAPSNAVVQVGQTWTATGSIVDPEPSVYTGTADYGDGGGPQPLAISDTIFTLEHTYQSFGIFAVYVVITNSNNGLVGASNFYIYVETDTEFSNLPLIQSPPSAIVNQGTLYSATGSFTDPNPAFSYTGMVDYGDGTGLQPLAISGNTFTLEHIYQNWGIFPTFIRITNDDNGSIGVGGSYIYMNAPPQIDPFPDATISAGETYAAHGGWWDADGSSWTVSVDYGDGSASETFPVGDPNLALSHDYPSLGTFVVTVTITDNRGMAATETHTVTVGPSNNTPSGSNITYSSDTGGITITFAEVTQPGNTVVTVGSTPPIPPDGYNLGTSPTYFEVSTTAVYDQIVTLCFPYDPAQYSNPSQAQLLHFENGLWVNITSSIDTNQNIVCGQTSTLSPFIVGTMNLHFLGFEQPVDNQPTINKVKGGRAIPIKWALKDAQGNYVRDLGAVVHYGYARLSDCSGATSAIDEYINAGSSSLRYDSSNEQFVLTSKTDSSWVGSCRMFTLRLSDGTVHQAVFQFIK